MIEQDVDAVAATVVAILAAYRRPQRVFPLVYSPANVQ